MCDAAERQMQIARDYQAGTDRRRGKRDGVVVTPVEVVDYIVKSTIAALKANHDADLTDSRVQITDPFAGTGIFMARLFQLSGLTGKALDDLVSRVQMIEIDPDAVRIAKANLAEVVAELGGTVAPKIITADTFVRDPTNLMKLGGVM